MALTDAQYQNLVVDELDNLVDLKHKLAQLMGLANTLVIMLDPNNPYADPNWTPATASAAFKDAWNALVSPVQTAAANITVVP